eukprot:tig00000241_g20991.t1
MAGGGGGSFTIYNAGLIGLVLTCMLSGIFITKTVIKKEPKVSAAARSVADEVEAFYFWLQDNGAIINKVALHDCQAVGHHHKHAQPTGASALATVAHGGRVIASELLKEGQIAMDIPGKLVLNCDNHHFSFLFPGSMPRRERFCAALRLLVEKNRGAESFWAPYIKLLPRESILLWYWTKEEVAELQNPLANRKLEELNSELVLAYNTAVLRIVRGEPKNAPAELYTLDNYRWAVSIVSSRSWQVGAELETYITTIAGQRSITNVVLRAARSYNAGEEFYGSHGARMSGIDSLATFGDLPSWDLDIHEHQILIPFPNTTHSQRLSAMMADRLMTLGIIDEETRETRWMLKHNELAYEMVEFARIAVFDHPMNITEDGKFVAPPPGFIDLDNECKALRYLYQNLRDTLTKYPTSLAADRRIIETEAGTMTYRRRAAVECRMNAKMIQKAVMKLTEKARDDLIYDVRKADEKAVLPPACSEGWEPLDPNYG